MNLLGAISPRYRALGVLAVTAALAGALGTGGPASAALSGSGWVARSVPAGFDLGSDVPPPLVSCVAGTRFCLIVAFNTNDRIDGNHFGQAPLVTTDGGRTWTGYGQLTEDFNVDAVSCPTTWECWAVGTSDALQPAAAETTNGGRTWTEKDPNMGRGDFLAQGVDCPTATTCYVVGANEVSLTVPAASVTTDGGATWQPVTNLPTFTPGPDGTYQLNAISCVTAQSCVAAGGLQGGVDPKSVVVSTDNGGSSWTMSADPVLSDLQQILGISCVPSSSASPACFAGGYSTGNEPSPVVLISHDGGSTWGEQVFDGTGGFSSVSCASAQFCWAAGGGTAVVLAGTSNGGASWSSVTSDTSLGSGRVSCLSASACVATTDNALWVTAGSGGIGGIPQRRPATRSRPWQRTGRFPA